MATPTSLIAWIKSPLSRRYGPANVPYKFGAETGLFQPDLTWAHKSPKLTPLQGLTRAGAKHPTLCHASTNSLKALCNLVPSDPLASWCHGVAMWGQDAKIGKVGRFRRPTRVGFRDNLVKPSLDSGPEYILRSSASQFGLLTHWPAAVPRGDGYATGQKIARNAKFGNVARTISCIFAATPEQ